MKKPEKNKDTEINQYAVGYTRGFNQCNSEWEKYHQARGRMKKLRKK